MADEKIGATVESPKTPQSDAHPEAITLQNQVKLSIINADKAGTIRTRVVDTLVEEEIDHRAGLLTKALAKRKAQAKELNKIRPDQCAFNSDGTPAFEHFSKPKLQERQKATQNLAKIDKAIDAAILRADYEGVKKIAE